MSTNSFDKNESNHFPILTELNTHFSKKKEHLWDASRHQLINLKFERS